MYEKERHGDRRFNFRPMLKILLKVLLPLSLWGEGTKSYGDPKVGIDIQIPCLESPGSVSIDAGGSAVSQPGVEQGVVKRGGKNLKLLRLPGSDDEGGDSVQVESGISDREKVSEASDRRGGTGSIQRRQVGWEDYHKARVCEKSLNY